MWPLHHVSTFFSSMLCVKALPSLDLLTHVTDTDTVISSKTIAKCFDRTHIAIHEAKQTQIMRGYVLSQSVFVIIVQ